MPWITGLMFLAGLLIIARGGGWFADGAVKIAARTGLPKVVVGATIVSLATTLPEFAVSSMASLSGNTATAVGNAIGSTIANVGLILAVAVLVYPLRGARIDRSVIAFALLAYLLTGFVSWDLEVSRLDAVLLFVLLAAYLYVQVRKIQKRERPTEDALAQEEVSDSLKHTLLLFGGGAVAVIVGSRLVILAGVDLARLFGIPELVIALTLISVGTSLPELVTSISAALRRHTDLAVGNILGANLLNLLWVLPGAALVRPLQLEEQTLKVDLPLSFVLMIGVSVALLTRSGTLKRPAALLILAAYAAYLVYLF